MCKVGAVLIDVDTSSSSSTNPPTLSPSQAHPSTPSSFSHTQQSSSGAASGAHISDKQREIKALMTPAVRKLVKENKIDMSMINGTGKDGRVLKEDVLSFLNSPASSPASSLSSSTFTSPPITTSSPPASSQQIISTAAVDVPLAEGDRVVTVSGLQRAMFKSMTAAAAIPHFGYYDEFIVDKLIEFRAQMKPIAERHGVKLTFLPIFLKAASIALTKYPVLNAKLSKDGSSMIYKASHNIGVAMDTAKGLIVPNVKDVQKKGILEIAAELNRMQKQGAEGKLKSEDLTGGTMTLSNIGTIGGTYASPVLMPGEVVIGAIGKIQKLPRFVDGDRVVAVSIVNLSWSADHRCIDGATVANFSNVIKSVVENPLQLFF